MIDEMGTAKRLVQSLAPPGLEVPIPEPLALDESEWLLTAVDKGVVEFADCDDACRRARPGAPVAGHFRAGGAGAHHLLAPAPTSPGANSPENVSMVLRRDYLPLLAAYARAVLEFGYDPAQASFRRGPHKPSPAGRPKPRPAGEFDVSTAQFTDSEGRVPLQISATGDRQLTRHLAAALDAGSSMAQPPAEVLHRMGHVRAAGPRYLWLVGPNSIDPTAHVFRVHLDAAENAFERIEAVPDAPSRSPAA